METVDRLFETGRAAWPDITLGAETFCEHVAALSAIEVRHDLALRAADLYLACAAAHGDPAAIAAVERTCIARIAPALSRIITPSEIDDVTQILRQRLFLGSDGRPRLLDYAGRGELRAWVRASAIRTAFEHLRKSKRERAHEADLAFGLPSRAEDPALDQLRRSFQRVFRTAFQASLAALDARQRTMLRQHFLDGLSTEELGTAYRIHRTTAFRWLREARAALLRRIRTELSERLHVGRDELGSLLRLVDSRFEISAQRIFAEA
ncbi:MAG TPA: sigma-70 family RNA polymerase sigma factor [Kofleriaceae bacterium]|jgi:RNA polymerase sigma-70 factor (ECF subfamily)